MCTSHVLQLRPLCSFQMKSLTCKKKLLTIHKRIILDYTQRIDMLGKALRTYSEQDTKLIKWITVLMSMAKDIFQQVSIS